MNLLRSYFTPLLATLTMISITHAQERLPSYQRSLIESIDSSQIQTSRASTPVQTLRWTPKQAPGFQGDDPDQRQQAKLSQDWFFLSSDTPSHESKISLPHSFPKIRSYQSAWYLTNFHLDELPNERLFLLLNRVDLLGVVYLNGKQIGHHLGSYTPFEFDITDAARPGMNSLAILVHDRSAAVDGDKAYNQLGPAWLESDYSQGRADKILPGGIDDVPLLEIRKTDYLKDVFVKTSTRNMEMELEVELSSTSLGSEGATLSFEVLSWPDGEAVTLNIPDLDLSTLDPTKQTLRVPWKNPKLWSPDHPSLYVLRTKLESSSGTDILDTRFGFREFWIEGKNFMLNGVPTRLRGESIYRPYRTADESYADIFSRYKGMFGSNACRIHAYMPHGDIILAADEAGVLLIDQSAIWSVNVMFYQRGGGHFLANTKEEFEEWARRDRNSPSVVIWDVENEMLRYNHELHLPWVSKLPSFIEAFDKTRPFNFSGGGWFDPEQDMASLHMQEHYTRIMSDWKAQGTQPLLMGEFWVGGRMEQRIPTSPEFTSAHERYREEGEIYRERILEMRALGVSGVMPFRISMLAFDRDGIDQSGKTPMRPADIYAPIKHALQAETVFVWPRQQYTSSSETFQRELVVCNDGETPETVTVAWGWKNQPLKNATLTLQPAEQKRISIKSDPPRQTQEFVSTLSKGNHLLAKDQLFVSPIETPKFSISKRLQVYADDGLASTLKALGLKASSNDSIPSAEQANSLIWIIPEGTRNRELNAHRKDILKFLDTGGAILCLKQDQAPLWFPIKLQFWSAIQTSPHTYTQMGWEGLHKDLFYSKTAPILMKDHPIFTGMENGSLHTWDTFDGRVSDDVFARPSNVNKYESGNWRPLASGTRREHVSLSEIFYGKGTLLSCQLNLQENLQNTQAKRLLGNMLHYLSDKSAHTLSRKIEIRGNLAPSELTAKLGVRELSLHGADPQKSDLMIAFEGTSPSDISDWAAAGGTVVVFSGSLSSTLPGVVLEKAKSNQYLGTKTAEHPLLGGVASSLFLNDERLPISGHFSQLPDSASALLLGFTGKTFWQLEDAGPILFRLPVGKGEILASSLDIDSDLNVSVLELLALILTNYGTEIANEKSAPDQVVIKRTVPITIDGQLDEWLEDMEDRAVTPYLHAQPIYLTSESIVEGPPEFDLNLSAINYFLWNEEALHLAGVVFGEERTFETGIGYGLPKTFEQQIRYGDDVITLSVMDDIASAKVNGSTLPTEFLATSKANSKELTDATQLQFSYILASGKIASVDGLTGNTFEIKIPWTMLKSSPSELRVRALLSLTAKGSKIQVPSNATAENHSGWLHLSLGGGK